MKKWAKKRKLTFWVHLFYVLVPALIALAAAVRLWTTIFGEWYFAVPLIVSLEGVAAVGFVFHLSRVESPFVNARHFIPYFSVATLGYELGAFLVDKHGWELGLPVTIFVTGVFGFLFIKSFGVLERLMIDPAEAAAEAAREQAEAILVPVAEHKARAAVYREFTLKLREAEQSLAAPSLPDGLDTHLLVAQLVEQELKRRQLTVAEGEQSLPFGSDPELRQAYAEQREELKLWDVTLLDGLENEPEYTETELACRGCMGPCGYCDEAAQAFTEARNEDEEQPDWDGAVDDDSPTEEEALAALAERGIERLNASELMALPDSPEREAEFKRRIGNSVDRGIDWLVEKGFITRKSDAVLEEPVAEDTLVAVVAPEPAQPASEPSESAVSTWVCSGCGAEGSNGSKGVAKKWSTARSLLPDLFCAACRKERA